MYTSGDIRKRRFTQENFVVSYLGLRRILLDIYLLTGLTDLFKPAVIFMPFCNPSKASPLER